MKYLIFSFLRSGVKGMHDIKLRYSTRNASKNWAKSEERERSLVVYVVSTTSYPAMCKIQCDAKNKVILSSIKFYDLYLGT